MRGRPDLTLVRLALMVVAGRRFWLLVFLPLAWLAVQAAPILMGREGEVIGAASAQGTLIGFPLTLLAVFLGIRIIAGEIDGHSLEIAYTVPGGCERVWWAKLVGSTLILLAGALLLALVTFVFFTPFPPGALYGAM